MRAIVFLIVAAVALAILLSGCIDPEPISTDGETFGGGSDIGGGTTDGGTSDGGGLIEGGTTDDSGVTILFEEDFSNGLQAEKWKEYGTLEEHIEHVEGNPALSGEYMEYGGDDMDVITTESFDSTNGLAMMLYVFLPSGPRKGASIRFYNPTSRDEMYMRINGTATETDPEYDDWIDFTVKGDNTNIGETTPNYSPLIFVPYDDAYHEVFFMVNADGSAAWSFDGETKFKREGLKPDDYKLEIQMHDGRVCLAQACLDASMGTPKIDDIKIATLGQPAVPYTSSVEGQTISGYYASCSGCSGAQSTYSYRGEDYETCYYYYDLCVKNSCDKIYDNCR